MPLAVEFVTGRHQHARAAQPELFGEIWIEPGEKPLPAELAVVADYDHKRATDEQ